MPEARTETFEYDGNNRLIARTNGEGERTESAYDGAGNRTQLTLAPGTGVEQVNTFAFDRDNRLIAGTDGQGTRTEYRYDGAGNKIETIQAAGIAAQERHSYYQYDLDNRLTQITDPMGGITQYTYDVLGNQTHIVNANGGVQTNTFDAVGRVLTSLSAGDILTVNTYDLRGNITSTTQSFGDGTDSRTTTYGYDLLDRQVRVTDPQGFSTTIAYDPFGNQVTITHGQYLLQPGDDGYDADKAAAAFVQSNGFVYDRADRMLSMEDALGSITAYTYDAVGNRTSMTEASNSAPRTTAYAYDRAGRLVQTTTPEGGIVQKTYDAAGNLSRERLLQSDDGTTPVWITNRFEYDANGRLAAEVDDYDVRTEFEYDAMGNRTTVRMAAGTADERTTGTEYDLNNRVSAEIDGEGHRTEYAYDAMGNRIKATDALGRTARYYFDSANNLVTILDAEGYINTFGYDAAGNRTAEIIYMTPYTGTADDFTAPTATPSPLDRSSNSDYDGNGRIVRRTEADGSETLYTYDGAGNLKSEVLFANTDAPRELIYEYDLNNRLIHFTDADGTVTTFGYDGANNRISETITSTTDSNAVRQTTYQYDLNNRRISQTFDPDGLNLVQTTAYDKLGNVIARTDANGHITRAEYDLNNRMVRTIDALDNVIRIDYDDVGNQIAVTDANLHKTEFVYDANNRLIQEITPEVYVYTTGEGGVSKRLVMTHVYDAVGNEVQTTDAAGFVSTRYYDNNNRLAFEINGDNVLRGYGYNGAGDRVSETLYMTRVPSDAHDPDARPVPPAGESRTTTTEYDHAGRATRTIYPAIEVTALSGTLTDDPAATVSTVQPEERNVYDAFGNLVESFDKQGNRTVYYYDIKGRMTAQVDPEGYLTEYAYDAQDNMTEQRIYTVALDPATIDAAVRPVAPAGDVYQTSRVYDAASRLIEEHSPEVEVYDHTSADPVRERVVTRFTYDGAGNRTSRTVGVGTPGQFTEYMYFDAANRHVATIDANRVVNYFGYDANGNQTTVKRFFNPVSSYPTGQFSSLDEYLASLDGATTDFASLVSAHADDQEIIRSYDELNRLKSEKDLMGPGLQDDLDKIYYYDGNGNQTSGYDEENFTQTFSYDALGNVIQRVDHDGSLILFRYDAAGNRIFAGNRFSAGQDGTNPVTNISAVAGNDFVISWDLNPWATARSYVVYDTVSHDGVGGYARKSDVLLTWQQDSASVVISPYSITGGQDYYFRVVTEDVAGNKTWTAEQRVTLPPRVTGTDINQISDSEVQVSIAFDSSIVNPLLHYGEPGQPLTTVPLADQGNGEYGVTLSGLADPDALNYRITWEDTTGKAYGLETSSLPYEISYAQSSDTTLEVTLRLDGRFTNPHLYYGPFDDINYSGGIDLIDQGDGTFKGTISGFPGSFSFGTMSYTVWCEDRTGGQYRTESRFFGGSNTADGYSAIGGPGDYSGTTSDVSWLCPQMGGAELVIIDGGIAADTWRAASPFGNPEGRLVVDPAMAAGSEADYSAYYGIASQYDHSTTVTATSNSGVYNLDVAVTLAPEEIQAMAGSMFAAYRASGSGYEFALSELLPSGANTFQNTIDALSAGSYDLKIYYLNEDGEQVIVDWMRFDSTATAPYTVTAGKSLTVKGSEAGGSISRDAAGLYSIDPGLFSGKSEDVFSGVFVVDEVDLALTVLGEGGYDDSQSSGGFETEMHYNALNALVAERDNQGRWIEYGVDANGNALVTHNHGIYDDNQSVTTFAAYDALDRQTAHFGAAVAVYGESGMRRPVTRYAYDVMGNVTREIDSQGNETVRKWNALGGETEETLAANSGLAQTTSYAYDALGNCTRETDALNRSTDYYYDASGNLERKVDAEGHATQYAYDVFGRRTRITDARGHSTDLFYDHRDRLVEVRAPARCCRKSRTRSSH